MREFFFVTVVIENCSHYYINIMFIIINLEYYEMNISFVAKFTFV